MGELEHLNEFLSILEKHTKRKRDLYDGSNEKQPVDFWLRMAIEELGEIAGAITRSRQALAKYECVDLAHCAYLIYQALEREAE